MKKIFIGICLANFCVCFATMAMAADPICRGKDVVVSDELIQTIAGATDANVYARFHDRSQPWVKMVRDGSNWVIPGGCDEDVHPYIGDHTGANYKPATNFAKLEFVYNMDAPFVKYRGPNKTNPCLHVDK